MSIVAIQKWRSSFHEELPLDQISDFPLLEACLRVWQSGAVGDGLPARLDPVELPRQILPMVFLFDLERAPLRLRVRLAGTAICEKHGRELRGGTPEDFFAPDDAQAVTDIALSVATTRRPSLARRGYVCLDDRLWNYTRLLLPLSRAGGVVDSFFKVADPTTMRRIH